MYQTIEDIGDNICSKYPLCKGCSMVEVCSFPVGCHSNEARIKHIQSIIDYANKHKIGYINS